MKHLSLSTFHKFTLESDPPVANTKPLFGPSAKHETSPLCAENSPVKKSTITMKLVITC